MHGSVAGLTRHDVGDRERELLVLIEEVVDVLVQRERADSLHWEEALRPNLRVAPFWSAHSHEAQTYSLCNMDHSQAHKHAREHEQGIVALQTADCTLASVLVPSTNDAVDKANGCHVDDI